MKRRNAIILLGTLTAMIAGYVAWCGRCFYLKRELVFEEEDTPALIREEFEDWHARTNMDLTAEFTWESFRHHLVRPMSDEDRFLRITGFSGFPGSPVWQLRFNRNRGICNVRVSGWGFDKDYETLTWTECYDVSFPELTNPGDPFIPHPDAWRNILGVSMEGEPGVPLPANAPERAWEQLKKLERMGKPEREDEG